MKTATLSDFLERNLTNVIIFGLLTLLYGPVLWHWTDGWLNKNIDIEHEYFSHGLIGLPFAAYIVYQQRKKWQRLENRSHPLGLALVVLGAIFYLTGLDQFVYFSFPIILAGVCLCLKGLSGLKLQWFPLLLVILATPNEIPYLITPYTFPLQQFIASVAGFILQQAGLKVAVEGIYLSVQGRFVEVAPYCAGLKMIFTSLYVTLMLLYWTDTIGDRRKVFTMLGSAVGISITANIIRNALLAWFHGTGQESKFVWLHDSWGGDLYSALMLLSIVGLFRLLEKYETRINSQKPPEDELYE
jgi:cyanoexosortase B